MIWLQAHQMMHEGEGQKVSKKEKDSCVEAEALIIISSSACSSA